MSPLHTKPLPLLHPGRLLTRHQIPPTLIGFLHNLHAVFLVECLALIGDGVLPLAIVHFDPYKPFLDGFDQSGVDIIHRVNL